MNTWGSLILIAALLVLAAVMLYARFGSRSREKSLHHAPSDWYRESMGPEVPEVPEEGEGSAIRSQIRLDRISGDSEPYPTPPLTRDYLDELQEAAAGLAKLMRSSPVARPEPVVFAPEAASEDAQVDAQEEAVPASPLHHSPGVEFEAEEQPAEIVEEVAEFVSLEPSTQEVEATFAEEEPGEGGVDLPPAPVLTLRERLGDSVVEQLSRIDAGLDALEELVTSIGEHLVLLADYNPLEAEEEIHEETKETGVAAAA